MRILIHKKNRLMITGSFEGLGWLGGTLGIFDGYFFTDTFCW
jgi:hypothetical protein